MPMHHQLAGRSRYGSLHTFVFVDIVGFTGLTDLESDDRALGRHRRAHGPVAG